MERASFHLSDSELSTSISEILGESHALVQPGASRITVVVLKARNLPKMDITGLSGEKTLLPNPNLLINILTSWFGLRNKGKQRAILIPNVYFIKCGFRSVSSVK